MPDREIGGAFTLDQMLGDVLLTVCPAQTRQEIEAEVNLLVAGHVADRSPEGLVAVAEILERPWDVPPTSRARLRLWAAVLRDRAWRPA